MSYTVNFQQTQIINSLVTNKKIHKVSKETFMSLFINKNNDLSDFCMHQTKNISEVNITHTM